MSLEIVPSRNITIKEWLLGGRVDVAVIAQASLSCCRFGERLSKSEVPGPNWSDITLG